MPSQARPSLMCTRRGSRGSRSGPRTVIVRRMRRAFVLTLFAVWSFSAAAAAQDFRTIPPLIPRPEAVNIIEGAQLTLTRQFTIFVPDDSPADRAVGEYLAQVIED